MKSNACWCQAVVRPCPSGELQEKRVFLILSRLRQCMAHIQSFSRKKNMNMEPKLWGARRRAFLLLRHHQADRSVPVCLDKEHAVITAHQREERLAYRGWPTPPGGPGFWHHTVPSWRARKRSNIRAI